MSAETTLWLVLFGVLALLGRSYLPGYFGEKGKNLATKEDIEDITKKVEEVKEFYTTRLKVLEHQNSLVLEQLRAHQQLRVAAVERRLSAHQEAFTLWRRLLVAVHSDDVDAVVSECQDWWNKNCLYLSAQARDSFNQAYFAARSHRSYVRDRANAESVQRNWAMITKAGEDIVAGAALPSLGSRELQVTPNSDAA